MARTERIALVAVLASEPPRGEWFELEATSPSHTVLFGTVGIRLEPDEPTAVLDFAFTEQAWHDGESSEALAAAVEHLFARPEALERVVAFVRHDDHRALRDLEAAGLAAVAVDGDELVYYRRRSLPSAGS